MPLTYDVMRELLYGTVGGEAFHLTAYSGGGRGRIKGRTERSLNSRLSTTAEVARGGKKIQRGGPLPPGDYECVYVQAHVKFHECIFLKPLETALAIHTVFASMAIHHGRGRFYIHGRGSEGSDGCIVPAVPTERLRLNKAVQGHPGTMLTVINASYMLPAEAGDFWA